jgi:hypothetical protein
MDNNKETISRLKFIGKIQIGEKVNLKYMYIQNDGFITQLSRIIFQENRSKTLTFLQDTVNKAFEILKCYQKSKKKSDKIMCTNLVEDLKNSKAGLINLKETYSMDIKFCCDIDTILQLVDAKLTETSPYILPPPPLLSTETDDDEEYSVEQEE